MRAAAVGRVSSAGYLRMSPGPGLSRQYRNIDPEQEIGVNTDPLGVISLAN